MKNKIIYSFVSIIILFIIWFIISSLNLFSEILLPSPVDVIITFFNILFSGNILLDFGATLFRTITGLVIGLIIGVPIGLMMGYFKKVYLYLEFLVDFLRSIPVTALIPLFLLFLGIGNESKIAIVVFVTALLIMINTMYGVNHANKLRIMIAKTMKLTNFQLFKKIIFPESLPYIAAGIRVAISMALIIVIVTEMFIGTQLGLGHRIIDAQYTYNTKEMYAVIILIGIVGYILNKFFLFIEKKKIHWAGK